MSIKNTFTSIGFDLIFLFWHLDDASHATAVPEVHSNQIGMFAKQRDVFQKEKISITFLHNSRFQQQQHRSQAPTLFNTLAEGSNMGCQTKQISDFERSLL